MLSPTQARLNTVLACAPEEWLHARPNGPLTRLGAAATPLRRVRRGERLYGQGDRLDALYEIYVGQFKTVYSDAGGRHQVTGFQLVDDLLGCDGLDSGLHGQDAVALEDSLVWSIPYYDLMECARQRPELHRELHRSMGREIGRSQSMMLLLGTQCAERRVATFLRDLIRRLQERGWSPTAMLLRMSRADIASYLGMTIETVCRQLSKLRQAGVLGIKTRDIHVLDAVALDLAAGSSA